MTMVGAMPATAAPTDVSEAQGKFLGGQALTINLDDLAEVEGALAENPSGTNPIDNHPLGVEALNALEIDLGDGLQLLGENGVIELGAVNQFAEAQHTGDAHAASGAVNDQGAIAVDGSAEYPSNATVNLANLLPRVTGYDSELLEDLTVELGALSSSIEQVEGAPVDAATQIDYDIADASLVLNSPAVGNIYGSVTGVVDEAQESLTNLSSALEEALAAELNTGLVDLNIDLNNFDPLNLREVLSQTVIGEATGVTVDLSSGRVEIDLDALFADPENGLPSLNNMSANSELLNEDVIEAIFGGITDAVDDAIKTALTGVQDTLASTQLNLEADLSILFGTVGVETTINANLSEIFGGQAEDVVTVDPTGSIGQLLEVLGIADINLLPDILVNALGAALGQTLGLVTDLDGVVGDILEPVSAEVLAPVLGLVTDVVSLTVNVQPETGDLGADSSTVRAAQLTLLPMLQTPLAQVNLASSTVRGTAVDLDPTVEVQPNAAQADDAVDMTGGDFAPNSELTIDIYDANDVQVGAVEGVSTDAEGNFTTPWTIPTYTDPGELTITVTDGEDNSANQTLDVYAPTVTPEPSSQAAGEPVELTGAGFVPNSTLTVEIAGADGVIATLEDVAVNDAGTFAEDWTIPAGTEPSELTVTASDNANELIFASANVTVEEPADDDADAADTDADADAADTDATDADGVDADVDADADGIDADSDAVDADATDATDTDAADTDSADADATDAGAADADADAADTDATDTDGVDADVDAADTDAADTDATDATDTDAVDTDSADADVTDADAAAADATDADATDGDGSDGDGTDTDTDAVDADATDGDTDSGYEAEVNVKPSDIEAGGTVTIEGNDFAPGSTVDVVITDADGAHIATIEDVQVDDAGEFSVDWDVPADTAAGTYTVTATDTQDEDISGSDELTVSEASDTDAGATDGDDANEDDPSINVDPETTSPGEEVTIEGDDFGPEETVTIEITDEDGNVIDTITVVTDDNGDFSVTWTVPQDVTPGTLTIAAADESGNTATAELTISAAGAGDSDSGDALASTGAKATMIATAIALLLIVIGAGLLIARRNNTVNDAS